jgi:hypothetical protein
MSESITKRVEFHSSNLVNIEKSPIISRNHYADRNLSYSYTIETIFAVDTLQKQLKYLGFKNAKIQHSVN